MNATTQQRGDALRRMRESRGLTQKQLGDLIGVSQSTVDKYESGIFDLKIDKALKIVTALNCTLGDLMGA